MGVLLTIILSAIVLFKTANNTKPINDELIDSLDKIYYGHFDAKKITTEVPELEVVGSKLEKRDNAVHITLGFENISKNVFTNDIKISIIYRDDEDVMLNAAAYPQPISLKPGQRTYRGFDIDDVMFGDVYDIVSYSVSVNYWE